MAAVLGGMTVLQLAELAAAINGGALSLIKIVDDLRSKGAKDTDVLPIEHQDQVADTFRGIVTHMDTLDPAQSFIQNTLGK
jgi:hypothetical protein